MLAVGETIAHLDVLVTSGLVGRREEDGLILYRAEPGTLGGLWARVDHDLCAGVTECLRTAPGAFQLDEDGALGLRAVGPVDGRPAQGGLG